MTVISRFSGRTLRINHPFPPVTALLLPLLPTRSLQEPQGRLKKLLRFPNALYICLSEGLATDTLDSGRKPDWPEQKRNLLTCVPRSLAVPDAFRQGLIQAHRL